MLTAILNRHNHEVRRRVDCDFANVGALSAFAALSLSLSSGISVVIPKTLFDVAPNCNSMCHKEAHSYLSSLLFDYSSC